MSYWDNIDREATKEWEHQQAFRYDAISEECLNNIRLIKNNQPTDSNEFVLDSVDADEFTDQTKHGHYSVDILQITPTWSRLT